MLTYFVIRISVWRHRWCLYIYCTVCRNVINRPCSSFEMMDLFHLLLNSF